MGVHRLRKEYTLFIDEFLRWSQAAGAEVHVPKSAKIQITELDTGQIEVCSLFHLANWPFKGASRKVNGKLTVLVRTREVYENNNVLVKSNVNTLYFKPAKKGVVMIPEVVWRQLDFPAASIKIAAPYAATAALAEADFVRFAAVAR